MLTPTQRSANLNQAQLRAHGEPIVYLPQQGAGAPIADAGGNPPLAILRKPAIMQSSAPGYFGDIEVDPLVIAAPQLKDVVEWAGVQYWVARVVNDPYGLTTLAIHRRNDP